MHGVIELVDYDPEWPGRFERERDRVAEAYPGSFRRIDHVGSTAVPGLAAKPVVDVQAVVDSVEAFAERKGPLLSDLGYRVGHELEDWHAHWRVSASGHRFNLHVKPADGGDHDWRDPVLFRDFLRDRPDVAAEYEALKRESVRDHPDDLEAYSRAKTDFVESVVDRAREAGYDDRLDGD